MRSDPLRLRSDLLLVLTTAIWGVAFVAQRTAMEHLSLFSFNAIRFLVGALVLLPVIVWNDRRQGDALRATTDDEPQTTDSPPATRPPPLAPRHSPPATLLPGLIIGLALFAGGTLQQAGLIYTTAGKAGFITSLYVVFVPLLGLALGHRVGRRTWLGVVLATAGLYFLTMTGSLRMAWGDLLVLLSALAWAVHMLLLGHFSPGRDPLRLAFVQFMTTAALSAVIALALETTTAEGVRAALGAILWAGVMSVGLGYTMQVVAQRHAPPADVALILSLEAVFAVLAGRLLLGEQLTQRALLGCALMLAGIIISQWPTAIKDEGGRMKDERPNTQETGRPTSTSD